MEINGGRWLARDCGLPGQERLPDPLQPQASQHLQGSAYDRIKGHSHKFCVILANRAAYCIELDSHKGFAA
jgi:hypothetical protein